MPDHACDRGAVRLDPGASRSQAYQPEECTRSGHESNFGELGFVSRRKRKARAYIVGTTDR